MNIEKILCVYGEEIKTTSKQVITVSKAGAILEDSKFVNTFVEFI